MGKIQRIKMIAFDLDGTLLTDEKKFTDYTGEVLERAASEGIVLVPSTGRPVAGVPGEVMRFPGVRYVVTTNGGRVVEAESGNTVCEKLLSVEKARKLLDIFGEYDTLREIDYDGMGYADEKELACIGRFVKEPALAEYILTTRTGVPDLNEKFLQESRGLDKVQALFASMDEKAEAYRRIREMDGIEASDALVNNIEINGGGVHKGAALLWLGEKLGIRSENMLAFGDGTNDTAMLRAAGTGVAMKNAAQVVKDAADFVTESDNNEGGVARFIEKYVLV